jgi:hypothetical protein
MANQPNITRRTAFASIGALVSTAALAVPAISAVAPAAELSGDALTHQLIGMYVTLTPGQRADARRAMKEAGLGEIADALDASAPMPRPGNLEDLFAEFERDARRIDPTIKQAWVYTDETLRLPPNAPRRKRLAGIQFERKGQPFARKAT